MQNPISVVQKRIDGIGMYRLVTLTLCFLVAVSLVFGVVGVLPYDLLSQILSLVVVLGVATLSNIIFAKLWRVSAHHESAIITALIIFFMAAPGFTLHSQLVIAATIFIAIASKFIIAWRRQHIFNPAAFGALALSFTGLADPAWWTVDAQLFIPLLLVGTLVVMKLRRYALVLWCLGVAIAVYLFGAWYSGLGTLSLLPSFFLAWPMLFVAFFMLTEPFTTPGTKKLQALYGALVGGLSGATFFVPQLSLSPEAVLIIGNLAFYPFSLRQKLYLTLKGAKEVAKNTKEFIFTKPTGLKFHPGQYLEWMLPHRKPDNRGRRRYFTIASAPHEDVVRLVVRLSEKGSSYKQALQKLAVGEQIIASQLAGDFILPEDTKKKLAFVAGGIGVTPFLSHFGFMVWQNIRRDVVLFYCNNTATEIAYREKFDVLVKDGYCHTVHILAEEEIADHEHGFLTEEIIKKHTPDYKERIWYLSGPSGMVSAYSVLLKKLGVPRENIHHDFFPGLA